MICAFKDNMLSAVTAIHASAYKIGYTGRCRCRF